MSNTAKLQLGFSPLSKTIMLAKMRDVDCAARRYGRAPYDMSEYIALLIRQDDARVRGRIKSISANRCGKCGDSLPVKSCPCDGDSACWVTRGWHETKLSV
ncbi:hypothetical protein PNB18_003238 [Salmonella enterica]|nr:hypothetical protein [Salmonella enterica]